MKLSIIEHNPSALKGYLNNPKWYVMGKLKSHHEHPIEIGGMTLSMGA